MKSPLLTEIKLQRQNKKVFLSFENGESFVLSCAYLRLFSPSADVKRQTNKNLADVSNVNITAIQPVGHYAVRLLFDDGHQTGIYTWETLYRLAHAYSDK